MTILNTVEVIERGWGWSWPGFICAIICIALIVFIFIFFDKLSMDFFVGLNVIATIFLIVSVFLFYNAKVKEQYNKYLVAFDDDVSINEVYENYNVIDREGIAFWITDVEGE